MKKTCFLVFGLQATSLLCVPALLAQPQSGGPLVLPDVTTAITGEDLRADDEAVPDFSGALPPDVAATGLPPELPEVSAEPDDDAASAVEVVAAGGRTVFMEGGIGFGWPYVFAGDFSVYSVGRNPFEVGFAHDSVGGCGPRGRESGFFDSGTLLSAEKEFSAGAALWNIGGAYSADGTGLQGKSTVFDDVNRRLLSGGVSLSVPLGRAFSAWADLRGEWFSRFAGLADSIRTLPEGDGVAVSFVRLSPLADFSWHNDFLSVALQGAWNSAFFLESDVPPSGRGSLSLSARMDFRWLGAAASVGAVFLPGGSGRDGRALVVPFSVGLGGSVPVESSPVPLVFFAEGGLESASSDFAGLDSANPFVNFTPETLSANREQSDWYASFSASIPVRSLASLDFGAEFRRTAYGNGVLCGDFSGFNDITGFFAGKAAERTSLETRLALVLSVGRMMFSAEWDASWLDVLPGQAEHSVLAVASCLGRNWGAELSARESVGFGRDNTPELGLSLFYRPSASVKLEFRLEDAIKLFGGKDRVLAAPYVTRSGTASVSVRFMR